MAAARLLSCIARRERPMAGRTSGDHRRRCDRQCGRLLAHRRSGLRRRGRRGRARPRLSRGQLGSVGELDPPAVLDPGEHRDRPVRHRLPARHRRDAGRERRAAGHRPGRARLPVPGDRARHGDVAREPCGPGGARGRCRAPDAGRAAPPLPLAHGRGSGRRLARAHRRGLVRRLRPAARLPRQGDRPGRPLSRRRSRGPRCGRWQNRVGPPR